MKTRNLMFFLLALCISANYANAQWQKAVDLGLSVKWADINVGSAFEEIPGYYFAWGETERKSEYKWQNYEHCSFFGLGSGIRLHRYNIKSEQGKVDNKTQLTLQDDAARVRLSDGWRIPTLEEWKELKEKCIWEWGKEGEAYGYRVISKKNGNRIFLPAAGRLDNTIEWGKWVCLMYWSSTLNRNSPLSAYALYATKDEVIIDGFYRMFGMQIRPVRE